MLIYQTPVSPVFRLIEPEAVSPSTLAGEVSERGVIPEHKALGLTGERVSISEQGKSLQPVKDDSDEKVVAQNIGVSEEEKNNKEESLEAESSLRATQDKRQEDVNKREIAQLQVRDKEVRAHELAHAVVGGSYAGSPHYEYRRGPDGLQYAVGGEVSVDTSAIAGDPQATLAKARIIKAAALAPKAPSAQDRAVAVTASRMALDAAAELAALSASEKDTAAIEKEEMSDDSERKNSLLQKDGRPAAYLIKNKMVVGKFLDQVV